MSDLSSYRKSYEKSELLESSIPEDPINLFKTWFYEVEAFDIFRQMDSEVNKDIVSFLSHCAIPSEQNNAPIKEGREQKTDMSRLSANKEAIESAGEDYGANEKPARLSHSGGDYYDPSGAAVKQEPVKVGPKVGRNDPCPCGSGKKFKNCHGKDA